MIKLTKYFVRAIQKINKMEEENTAFLLGEEREDKGKQDDHWDNLLSMSKLKEELWKRLEGARRKKELEELLNGNYEIDNTEP